MNWLIGKHKVRLPERINDSRPFKADINGRTVDLTWHPIHGILAVTDQNGVERNIRIADLQAIRNADEGTTHLSGRIGLVGQSSTSSLRPFSSAHAKACVDLPGGSQRQAESKKITVIKSPITGKVLSCATQSGRQIEAGALVIVIEAMKMENRIVAPIGGLVSDFTFREGSAVKSGDVLCKIVPNG